MGAYDQFIKETKGGAPAPAPVTPTPAPKEGLLKTAARILLPKPVENKLLGEKKPAAPATPAPVVPATSAFERFKQETGQAPKVAPVAATEAPEATSDAQRMEQTEAVKNVAVAQLGRLTEQIAAATKARDTKLATIPAERRSPISGRPLNNQEIFEEEQTLKNLENAKKAYEFAIENEGKSKGFLKDLWDGVKMALEEPEKLVPFLGSAASVEEGFGALKAFEKQKAGETLSPYETSLIEKYQAKSLPTQKQLGTQVGATIAQLPTFALEFAMTAGVYAGARVVALKGITKGLENVAPKLVIQGGVATLEGATKLQTATKLASEITAAAIAGATQGAANVPAVANKTVNYMLPSYNIVGTSDGDKLSLEIDKQGDTFGKAFAKAFGTQSVEYITERTGVVVEKPLEFIQKATLGRFLQKRGITSSSNAYKLVKEKISWNGIIGEVFEEELSNLGQAPIEGRPVNLPFLTPEGTERLLVETLAIAAFGGIGKISDVSIRKIAGTRSDEENNPEVKISTTKEVPAADLQKEIEANRPRPVAPTPTEETPAESGAPRVEVKETPELQVVKMPVSDTAQKTLDGIKESKQDFDTERALQIAEKIAALAGSQEITPAFVLEAAQWVSSDRSSLNTIRTPALFKKGGGGLEMYKRAEQIGLTDLLDTKVPELAEKTRTSILKLEKKAQDVLEGWVNRIVLTPEAEGALTRADLERVNAVLVRAARIRKKYNEESTTSAHVLQAISEVGDKKPTQKEKVEKVVEGKEKSIQEVSRETGILEPNVRRILGVGAKDGTFERVSEGVYTLKKGGKSIAFVETGNAVESLPKLAADGFKADMIFLDIPYDTPAVKGGSRGVKYELLSVEDFKKVMQAVSTIARDEKTPLLYMYSQAVSGEKAMARYNQAVLDAGFKPIAKGEWQKLFQNGLPTTNVRGKVAKPEGILLLTKSGEFDKDIPNLSFALTRPKGYSTEKPEAMLKALIESTTDEGEMVLDPFAGSGVTGAAAIKSGREAYLIEKNPEQAEAIKKRLESAAQPATAEEAAETYYDEVITPRMEEGKAIVIGADDLKDYFGRDYDLARHKIYSGAADILFRRAVDESKADTVKFLVGGAGAGKSNFLVPDASEGFSGVVYDSTGWNYEGYKKQIDYAKERDKGIEIYGIVADVRRSRAYTFKREASGEHPVTEAAFARTHAGSVQTMLRLAKEGESVFLLDTRPLDTAEKVEAAEFSTDPIALLEGLGYSESYVKDLVADISKENYEETIAGGQGGVGDVPERDGAGTSDFPLTEAKESIDVSGTLPELAEKESDFYAYVTAFRYGGKENPAGFSKIKGKQVSELGYDFFVHRPVRTDRENVVQSDKGWIVSDGYTGRSVTNESYPTQKEAIGAAKEVMAKAAQVKALDETIVEAIRATGLSPRYKEKAKPAPKLTGQKGADIGSFRDGTPYKLHESLVKPVQFPEIVRIATQLMNDAPKVVQKFRKEGKRGDFLPMGDGRIRLLGELFERKNLHQLSATLAHELGHLIDYLPDHTMARGNLIGRLATLRDFRKDFMEGSTRSNEDLREQMYALSKYWRPYDERTAGESFIKYRKSSEEIYADFISALFNDPYLTQDMAPSAYNLFFAELDKKPAVKKAYFELQALLTDRNSVLQSRREATKEMFEQAEYSAKERQRIWLQEEEAKEKSIWFRFKTSFIDRNEAFRELVAKARKEGRPVNADDNPVFYLEEYNYLGGKMKAEIESRFNDIYLELQKENLSWEDLGEVMFYERVLLGDRGEVANPLGYQPDFVQDLYEDLGSVKEGQNKQHEKNLADMKTTLGAEKFEFLKSKAAEFRKNLKGVFEMGYREGLYSEELKKTFDSNDFYVPFRPIKYAGQRSSFSVKGKKGTLQAIENPANTAIEKAIAIIRAVERNKVKRASIKFLQKESPEVLEEPKTIFDGKRQTFLEPREKDIRLVTFMEDGKVQGFYVNDPYIGDALLLNTVSQSNVVLDTLRFANSRFFRPLFITFNLGFQSFNLFRDFWRFWKNVPDMSILRSMNLYAKSFRAAKVRAFGLKENASERDKEAAQLIESMEEQQILSLTFNDILKGQDLEDREIDRIMQSVGVKEANPQGWAAIPALKPVHTTLEFVEKLGNLIETLPKVAGKIELEGKMPPKEMRSFIRRYVGSPDFLAGGTAKPWSNEVFLFSNAIFQGIRADYEIATNKASTPNSAFGWWWKTATVNLAPKLIMQLVLAGLAGDALKEMLEDVSEYDKTNYIIIPLGKDQNNKTMYVRVPQDETGRFVSGMFWKAMSIAKDPKKALSLDSYLQVLSYTGGQLPSASPVIESVQQTAQFIAGQNPYDSFRGRQVLTDDQQQAGGMARLKPFAFYIFEQMGGGIFVKLYSTEQQTVPREKTLGEKIITAPAVSNIIGRWVKVSNYGQTEKIRSKVNELRSEQARERIATRETVYEYVQKSQGKSPAETRAIQQQMITEILGKLNTKEKQQDARELEKRFKTLRIRGSADARVDSMIVAKSNDEKALLLNAYKESMSESEFKELQTFLLREKIITPDVLQKTQAATK